MGSRPARSRGFMSRACCRARGAWASRCRHGLWPALRAARANPSQASWMAWHADPGRAACARLCLDPHLRRRSRKSGAENKKIQNMTKLPAGHAAAVHDLQAQVPVEPHYRLRVDGRELLRLLRDLGNARYLSAEGTGLDSRRRCRSQCSGATSSRSSRAASGAACRKRSDGAGRSSSPAPSRSMLVPIYLQTTDPTWFLMTFLLFICFVGGKDALNPGSALGTLSDGGSGPPARASSTSRERSGERKRLPLC